MVFYPHHRCMIDRICFVNPRLTFDSVLLDFQERYRLLLRNVLSCLHDHSIFLNQKLRMDRMSNELDYL